MNEWFDTFNGIRIPETGSCVSFEHLLNEVLKKKLSMGIDLMDKETEERSLWERLEYHGRAGKKGCCS